LPNGTTLEIFLDDPGHVRLTNPDEELRSRCLLLQRAIGRPVTLVTGIWDCSCEPAHMGLVGNGFALRLEVVS
jgi:hypothetical protein